MKNKENKVNHTITALILVILAGIFIAMLSGCSHLGNIKTNISTLKHSFVYSETEYLIQSSDPLLRKDIDDIKQTIILSEKAFQKNYGFKYGLPTIIINYWNTSAYPGYKYGDEFNNAYTIGYIIHMKVSKPIFGTPHIATLDMQNILIHELYHVYTHSDNQLDANWFINEVKLLGTK